MAKITHGTRTGYTHHRCRCHPCSEANRRYERERLARRHPVDAPHGTVQGYAVYSCRCSRCRQANRLYQRKLREGVDPSRVTHGTTHGYNFYGCRCDECREAHRARAAVQVAKRRLRIAQAGSAPYEREDVFARDNWVCQLCFRPVDRDAPATDPEGPTIDHVVAIANGGADVPDNVQTAHARCNREKWIGMPDQLIIPETAQM